MRYAMSRTFSKKIKKFLNLKNWQKSRYKTICLKNKNGLKLILVRRHLQTLIYQQIVDFDYK
jgi:hypothetical protein